MDLHWFEIKAGGYFEMDEVTPGTDHRCLWIDVCYSSAFGHLGTIPIVKPAARRLHTYNPTICDSFITLRKKYIKLGFSPTHHQPGKFYQRGNVKCSDQGMQNH
jgi:hypothetical protein